MKYISLISICVLLLGASGDSERPARWESAKSEFSRGDFELLDGLFKIFLQHEERYGISSHETPDELISLEKIEKESKKILEDLNKISDNPEALKRFKNVIAKLGDSQSSEGKLFWSIVHDVAINSDDRRMFTESIKFSAICGLKGVDHHACVLSEWEYPPFLPFWTTDFGKRLHAFNETSLGNDLDWLGNNLSSKRDELKDKYETWVVDCTFLLRMTQGSEYRSKCSQNYDQILSALNAEVVPDVLKDWDKYKTEIGIFLKSEGRLPKIINLSVRYLQFLVGYSAPKNVYELDETNLKTLLGAIQNFLKNKENGMPAILHYAQE